MTETKHVKTNRKKLLLAYELRDMLAGSDGFLGREDIALFSAATTDDVLKIHLRERTDLIVIPLEMPGIRSEDLFSEIRERRETRSVSSIIICKNTLAQRERCKKCGANAVFTLPVDADLLRIKIQQLLNVAPRKSYRAVLALAIQGRFKKSPLGFWTENISASGMLIKSEQPLTRGEAIFFSFFLPNGIHVSGYGEIVRIIRSEGSLPTFYYGVKFTNVDSSVVEMIMKTVNKGENRQ